MTKDYKTKDPHYKREKDLYEHPAPSREFILDYLKQSNRPSSLKMLLKLFKVKDPIAVEGMRRRLLAMERDGQLYRNRQGHFSPVKNMMFITGVVQGHRDGFGFLIPDDHSPDIFIPAREMHAVFPNDRVTVRVSADKPKGREGMITEVLERKTSQCVGRYIEEKGVAFVEPDNPLIAQTILISSDNQLKATPNQFVLVEIIQQPTKRSQAVGQVIRLLGDDSTPGIEMELALHSYHLPYQWPDALVNEVNELPQAIPASEKRNRISLTHLPFVTIDGEDAQDFDDAVYCESAEKGGWTLYVAIADVAYYVKPGSELDQAAMERGNSVYFPAKVLPMLPERLSNDLCSLKPKQDRLVMVCEMNISKKGELKSYQFYEATIYSVARLTYNEVSMLLVENEPSRTIPNSDHLLQHIKELYGLYLKLREQRVYRGAIEFDTTDTKIQFDEQGKIKSIIPIVRNDAHRMIEECMLMANVSASFFLQERNIPTLYRVHEGPDAKKIKDLKKFLSAFSLRLMGGDKPSPRDYSKLLARVEKRPNNYVLQTMILRSLKQATYKASNIGHFGLSYEQYCHFTSPIRRYPDLIVHRGIKHLLQKQPITDFPYNLTTVAALGDHCSMTERRADRAVRDANDWLKCQYMQDKLGQVFDGRITDVTSFGVFVELEKAYVSGLIHITALGNDQFIYEPIHRSLTGRYGGRSFRLGDSLRVQVSQVDLDNKRINFDLIEILS